MIVSSVFSPSAPLDCACLSQCVQEIRERFPFVQTERVGRSLLGRPILVLSVGGTHAPVLIAAAFHGMEWITGWIALRFFVDLCLAMERDDPVCGIPARDFLREHGVFVLPCANPDGVEIQIHGPASAGRFSPLVERVDGGDPSRWQANARGVDLNHNFDANWLRLRRMEREAGINGPAPTQFGGRFPESEPESACLAAFCRRRGFLRAAALHTQGWEIYYRYGRHTPPESPEIARRMAEAGCCTLGDPQGLASMGGFKDWFIDCFRRPGFTLELGVGRNPLPLSDAPEIYRRTHPMLLEFLRR